MKLKKEKANKRREKKGGLQTNPPERNRCEKVMGLLQSQPNLTRFLASSCLTLHLPLSLSLYTLHTYNIRLPSLERQLWQTNPKHVTVRFTLA
ncbi:hypothetical protein CR513_32135, partial [Mucuna pruriens]